MTEEIQTAIVPKTKTMTVKPTEMTKKSHRISLEGIRMLLRLLLYGAKRTTWFLPRLVLPESLMERRSIQLCMTWKLRDLLRSIILTVVRTGVDTTEAGAGGRLMEVGAGVVEVEADIRSREVETMKTTEDGDTSEHLSRRTI
jgi:hypothetical protein